MPLSKLDFDDRIALAKSLLACPCMSTDSIRALIVNELSFKDMISREGPPFAQVLEIVNTCLDYPRGLESLVDAIAIFDGGSHSLQSLYYDLQQLLFQPVSWKGVADLKSILKGATVPENVVKASYRKFGSYVPLLLGTASKRELLLFSLDHLAKMSCTTKGTVPVLDFLSDILPELDDVTGAAVKIWMDGMAAELDTPAASPPHQTIAGASALPAAQTPDEPFLLIKVEPVRWKKDPLDINSWRFEVRGWLLYAGQYHPLSDSEKTYRLAEIPGLLRDLINETQDILPHLVGDRTEVINDLIIEVFLPIQLLACEIDRWTISMGDVECPVGTQYRVAVRSFERAYGENYKGPRFLWKKKWRERPRVLQRDENAQVYQVHDEAALYQRLFYKLKKSDLVFLSLIPYPADPKPEVLQVWRDILSAGLPIALWPRQEHNHTVTAKDELHSLLYDNELEQVPRLICDRRCDAAHFEHPHALWDCLTFMWDDPDRLPPDVLFGKMRTPLGVEQST